MADELIHYGIKGMRWGVRRERGPDGTVGGRRSVLKGDTSAKYNQRNKDFRSNQISKKIGGTVPGLIFDKTVRKKGIRTQLSKMSDKQLNRYADRISKTTKYAVVSEPTSELVRFVDGLVGRGQNLAGVTPQIRKETNREVNLRVAKYIEEGMNRNSSGPQYKVKPVGRHGVMSVKRK